MTPRENRALLSANRCYLCLRVVPSGEGVYWAGDEMLLCRPFCHGEAVAIERDMRGSARGRRRRPSELRRLLRARRADVAEMPR